MINPKRLTTFAAILFSLCLLALFSESARASGSLNVHGTWAGPAFANPEFDIDHDGISGRQFDFHAYDQVPFSDIEGVLDSHVTGEGCAGHDESYSFRPLGRLTMRARNGDALYGDYDPTAPDLCVDLLNTAASITVKIVFSGGTGNFASAAGTGTFIVRDVARLTRPVNFPPFGIVPAPTMIDSKGEFTLSVH